MTKIQTPEQIAALGQANLESLMSLAGSAIARAERLAELNLNTVRSVLEDSMATTKKLAEAKNPQDLASLQTELTKPLIDKAVAYARSSPDPDTAILFADGWVESEGVKG